MANIRQWLEEAERQDGGTIEAIVVGVHSDRKWSDTLPDENVVLAREDGLKKLDLEYDNGFGEADCYPMFAWSPNWIYYIHEYDRATSLYRLPRNPRACTPSFG